MFQRQEGKANNNESNILNVVWQQPCWLLPMIKKKKVALLYEEEIHALKNQLNTQYYSNENKQ